MLYQKNWYIYIYIYYLLVTAVVVTEKVASFFSEALKAAFNNTNRNMKGWPVLQIRDSKV